jgi:hypothetical protein
MLGPIMMAPYYPAQFDYRAVTHRDSVFDVYEQMVEIVKHQTVTALYGVHPHAGWCVHGPIGKIVTRGSVQFSMGNVRRCTALACKENVYMNH